jgi:hypothetical protein
VFGYVRRGVGVDVDKKLGVSFGSMRLEGTVGVDPGRAQSSSATATHAPPIRTLRAHYSSPLAGPDRHLLDHLPLCRVLRDSFTSAIDSYPSYSSDLTAMPR